MSITVNGQSCVPPGFRFHPTEEELLTYYLKKKVASERIDLDVIPDVDLNKLEPWDIQERCRIGSGPQNDWYFFSHKDKKYPTGTRTNRATAAGFWKATGRDKAIYTSFRRIGMRKTLVFYKGRAPHGQKSDWIMHEYRRDDHPDPNPYSPVCGVAGEQAAQEEGWVVCRVFKKKSLQHQTTTGTVAGGHAKMAAMEGSPSNCSSVITVSDHARAQMLHSASDDALDHILEYMGRSCKQAAAAGESKPMLDSMIGACPGGVYGRFMKLPALEAPRDLGLPDPTEYPATASGLADWDAMDRLAACELNGLADASKHMASFFDDAHGGDDGDLWSLARSVSSSLHGGDLTNNVNV